MKSWLIFIGCICIIGVLVLTFALMNAASRLDRLEDSWEDQKQKEE